MGYDRGPGQPATPTAQAVGAVPLVGTPPVFNQTANSATTLAVPADVNVGSLVLLTDAITAIGTLQATVNTTLHLLNRIIDRLQELGIAT